jgi:aminoglycoside phosphotransferase (APT) family kinase protein
MNVTELSEGSQPMSAAIAAAIAVAGSLGLTVDDAVVLQNSNKLALRLVPCDTLARVAPAAANVAQFEIDIAAGLARYGCPIAALEPGVRPRVYARDGFVITLWTYYEPAGTGEVAAGEYAEALARLHAGMRRLGIPAPHFSHRVESARRLLASPDRTPDLPDDDRHLLDDALHEFGQRVAGRGREQLLHGEPHPGNLLATKLGPLFIDFETCCTGPVEFDVAHAPEEVATRYPGLDPDLLQDCRMLVLAMVTTWRWDRDDRLPDGRRLAQQWLAELRTALDDRR